MTFDSGAPLAQIVTLLQAVPGMGAVQIGAPLSWSKRVNAYVTLGPQVTDIKATGGSVYRDASYFVDLGYRCDDDTAGVTAAETTLGAALDALFAAVYADKTLAGTCQNTTIETVVSEEPEYRMRGEREYREYVVRLTCRQYDQYNATP